MNDKTVIRQFGANARAYASSEVHARGPDLARLLELVDLQPNWVVLDVATAAGHTAHAVASHVARVMANDITPEMPVIAREQGRRKGIDNVHLSVADAHYLPYRRESFDLVTCRLATHHFHRLDRFMAESHRLLRSPGILVVLDNIVPGSYRSDSKAMQLRRAGRYINTIEKLRDPSHVKCLSIDEWQEHFYQAGFQMKHREVLYKELDFNEWAARMRVPVDNAIRLRAMIRQAPSNVAEFLSPTYRQDQVSTFRLSIAVMLGLKKE